MRKVDAKTKDDNICVHKVNLFQGSQAAIANVACCCPSKCTVITLLCSRGGRTKA